MTITNAKKGVWKQSDVVKKINADRWTTYVSNQDPTKLEVFGTSANNGDSGLNAGAQSLSSPVQIPGTTWCKISFGAVSAGIKNDNTLWIWGNNTSGQLGQNDTVFRSSPVQIPGTDWCDVSVGQEDVNTTVFGLKIDNTLWGWGSNFDGEIPINDSTIAAYSSPVQIPGASWCKVSAGCDNHLALRTDGSLWTWGISNFGSNGLDNNFTVSSPTQLPGTWIDIATTGNGGAAIKSDNTLWVWGRNTQGQLGQLNQVHRSSPTQIPGTTWCAVSAYDRVISAIQTDNTLWVWGANNVGQLGINNRLNRSSPIQLTGTTWNCVEVGFERSLMKKSDGSLWMTGNNTPISDTSLSFRSSPTQIPGTDWIDLSVGNCVTGLIRL